MSGSRSAPEGQATLFPDETGQVREVIFAMLGAGRRPSAWEVLEEIENKVGFWGGLCLRSVLSEVLEENSGTRADKAFIEGLLESTELELALAGGVPPRREAESTIDSLVQASLVYGSSGGFQEVIQFMAKFKTYSPFNNMLVWLQNPSCPFYATERDWWTRFSRVLNPDARPMIILAPMHPVLLVYDLDQTDGPPLPEHLVSFAKVEGDWNPSWWRQSSENAKRDKVLISVVTLSSTLAGLAKTARGLRDYKMQVKLHDGLDQPSRFGTLCHELGHIYLGHLGSDPDYWWPNRVGIDRRSMEVEAEAVAHLVTSRLGLKGSSAAYVSRYLEGGKIPPGVSLDLIAKVASRIESMALRALPARKPRPAPARQRPRGRESSY